MTSLLTYKYCVVMEQAVTKSFVIVIVTVVAVVIVVMIVEVK